MRTATELGERYSPERSTFAKYHVYHPNQKPVLERIIQLSAKLDALVSEGTSIILYGPVGTGKDHLLAALLYEAARRFFFACAWRSSVDLYRNMRDRMDSGETEEGVIRELAKPAILALSDPPPPDGELSAFKLEFLFSVIDRRYRKMLPTWITINVQTTHEAEMKLSTQIWDRLQHGAEIVPCFWPSYRERKQKGETE